MRGLLRRAASAFAMVLLASAAAAVGDPSPSTGFRVVGDAKTYYFAKHDVIGTDGAYTIVEAYGNRFVFPKAIQIVDVETGHDVPDSRRHDDLEAGYLTYLRTLTPSAFRTATCPDCLFTGTIPASRAQYFADGDPEANPQMRAAMRRARTERMALARASAASAGDLARTPAVFCNPDGLMSCADCDVRYRCVSTVAESSASAVARPEPVCDLPHAKFDPFVGVCFLTEPAVPNPFAPSSLQR